MINCPGTCSSRYLVGTVVNLTATPPSDSEFVGWTGDIVSSDNPLAVTVTGVDRTINAVFNLKPVLSIAESGSGAGTVTSDVGGISCPGTCSHAYLTGTVVTLTATPDAASVFSGWTGDVVSGSNPVMVTMTGNKTVNATFTSVPAVSILAGNSENSVCSPTSTNIYFEWGDPGDSGVTATVGNAQKRMPIAVTVSQITAQMNAALASGSQAAVRMNVNGSGSNNVVMAFGTAGAPTAALVATASGNLTSGVYKYKVTWVINGFENAPSSISNSVTVDGTHKQVSLSGIPAYTVGTTGAVVTRNVYRTEHDGSTYKFLTAIADNTTTTFTDNVADVSLGASQVTNLAVGSQAGAKLSLAQDDLVCLEATGFVTATIFDLLYMYIVYRTAGSFLTGRFSTFTNFANNYLAVFDTSTGQAPSSGGAAGWVPKQVTLGQATLTVNAAPGGSTTFTVQVQKDSSGTMGTPVNVGTGLVLTGSATSVRTNVNGVLPATTTQADSDSNFAIRGGTSGVATTLRAFFSYVADSPDGGFAFYSTGRNGFNNTSGTPSFLEIHGWNNTNVIPSVEASTQFRMPVAGTFKYLGSRFGGDGASTWTMTLNVNGVASAFLLTAVGGAAFHNDYTTTVHVNAGDLVGYKFVRTVGGSTQFSAKAFIGFLLD